MANRRKFALPVEQVERQDEGERLTAALDKENAGQGPGYTVLGVVVDGYTVAGGMISLVAGAGIQYGKGTRTSNPSLLTSRLGTGGAPTIPGPPPRHHSPSKSAGEKVKFWKTSLSLCAATFRAGNSPRRPFRTHNQPNEGDPAS